jgi:hypothetical protein
MSGTTVFGIVLISVSALAIGIVAAMFLWAAREDGRDQARTNARIARGSRHRSRKFP